MGNSLELGWGCRAENAGIPKYQLFEAAMLNPARPQRQLPLRQAPQTRINEQTALPPFFSFFLPKKVFPIGETSSESTGWARWEKRKLAALCLAYYIATTGFFIMIFLR
jgi:hypothetical protein